MTGQPAASARPARAAHSVAVPPCDCVSMAAPFPPLIGHALADRETPPADRESLAKPITDGELRDVAPYGARRTDAQRHPEVAPQPHPLIRVPGAAVVQERGDAHAQQSPRVV